MRAGTFMSTEWIEVHDNGYIYDARVFLTDDDSVYMTTVRNGKKRFFKVNANLLKLGEFGFFKKVMENAKELDDEIVDDMGFSTG